jgi:Zn ribbon nucleic-acid-binding protein
MNANNVQKVECINCGENIALLRWEQHMNTCSGGRWERDESAQVIIIVH